MSTDSNHKSIKEREKEARIEKTERAGKSFQYAQLGGGYSRERSVQYDTVARFMKTRLVLNR